MERASPDTHVQPVNDVGGDPSVTLEARDLNTRCLKGRRAPGQLLCDAEGGYQAGADPEPRQPWLFMPLRNGPPLGMSLPSLQAWSVLSGRLWAHVLGLPHPALSATPGSGDHSLCRGLGPWAVPQCTLPVVTLTLT